MFRVWTSRQACSRFPFVETNGQADRSPTAYVHLLICILTLLLQTEKLARLGSLFIVPLTACPLPRTQLDFRDETGGKSPGGGVHAHVGSASRVWTCAGGWFHSTSWVQLMTSRLWLCVVSKAVEFMVLKVSSTLALSVHVTLGTCS